MYVCMYAYASDNVCMYIYIYMCVCVRIDMSRGMLCYK